MLQSHLHSLIAKAHRYQAEPERFERTGQDPLQVMVHGANGDHQVVLREGRLECDCDGFAHRGERICAHVLGVERVEGRSLVSYELQDEEGLVLERVDHAILDDGWWRAFQPMRQYFG